MSNKPAGYYLQHPLELPEEGRTEALRSYAQLYPQQALQHAAHYILLFPEAERWPLLQAAAEKAPGAALTYVPAALEGLPAEKRVSLVNEAIEEFPATIFTRAANALKLLPKENHPQFFATLERKAQEFPKHALLFAGDYLLLLPEEKRAPLLQNAARQQIESMEGFQLPDDDSRRDALLCHYLPKETRDSLEETWDKAFKYEVTGVQINDLHELPDKQRFANLKNMSATRLYELITFGREEMYTSTYKGVFKELQAKLEDENKNLFDVADPRYPQSVAIFLEEAATYNNLKETLPFIPKEKWGDILKTFGSKIEDGNVSYAVTLAEIAKAMPDPEAKEEIRCFIQQKFSGTLPGKAKDTYGLLANYYNSITPSGQSTIDLEGKQGMYTLPPMDSLGKEALLGKDGIHRQLVVFSEDEDGKDSYASFIKRYQNNDKYKVTEEEGYIKITALKPAGTKMEMYANKPDHSPEEILKGITGNPLPNRQNVEFDAVIHRGHSYNLEDTLPYIGKDTRFIYLGSCGGYDDLQNVLKLSPHAQVIATREIGTMNVNDPLLYHINESIRTEQDVNWKKEQTYLDGLASEGKHGYILPHRNNVLMMQQQLNKLDRMRDRLEISMPRQEHQPRHTPMAANDVIHPGLLAGFREAQQQRLA